MKPGEWACKLRAPNWKIYRGVKVVNVESVSLDEIERQSVAALVRHGASEWVAREVARAIRKAEANSNKICGLYYLESYCVQLQTGRVDGRAEPEVSRPRPGAVFVDARLGFAQSAFARGIGPAIEVAREMGNCSMAVGHSHTCTAVGYFTEQFAQAGLLAIGMTNAPACVSPPGGNRAVLGTNPVAMSVPAKGGGVAFQFDQSTSAIAIGKIRVAAANGDKIPLGWAVDKNGDATDDPNAALEGSLLSAGGYKGFGFGLMAELLASAATGSLSSCTAPPLKAPEGPAHDLGQYYLIIDPTTFSGDQFWEGLDALAATVSEQQGARLPGSRPIPEADVEVDAALWQTVLKLAS